MDETEQCGPERDHRQLRCRVEARLSHISAAAPASPFRGSKYVSTVVQKA
jgi:hypothetical protein